MTAKSDASNRAAPGGPPVAPARAVVLTSLIQLVAIAMNLRLRHRRSLRAIERNLADSDPSLTKLFSTFTVLAQGEERGRPEKVKARPLRALARRLATALEFDPADPWRRSKSLRRAHTQPCKGIRLNEATPEIEAGRGFWYLALGAAKEDYRFGAGGYPVTHWTRCRSQGC